MSAASLLRRYAHPAKLHGPVLEAPLPGVFIGELCHLRRSLHETEVVARAQVVGFRQDMAVLSLLGQSSGLSRQWVVMPTGQRLTIEASSALLGTVLDATGQVRQRLAPSPAAADGETRCIEASPPAFDQRRPIRQPLLTGVRAIDGVLTCGEGQRVGIFAAAGCGKTSLMNMLIEHADADVFVVGLVGERGREVTEFIQDLLDSGQAARTILVYATSDQSSVDRCNAALIATTLAEYFRDAGQRVLLFVDSMTRYARALRDVALAAGEMPARRGYPASVFEALPRLLERPGKTACGSITAFYTILIESEEEPDPIGDEVRSILDGHLYLTRKLAGKGHFPAIDVQASASRVFPQVTDDAHQAMARQLRALLSRLEDLQVIVDLGEYRPGENPDNDHAMQQRSALEAWLRQDRHQASAPQQTLEAMHALLA
jgi:type III secretion protein N (ATPase)